MRNVPNSLLPFNCLKNLGNSNSKTKVNVVKIKYLSVTRLVNISYKILPSAFGKISVINADSLNDIATIKNAAPKFNAISSNEISLRLK